MANNDYIPKGNSQFIDWGNNCSIKLTNYQVTLGLDAMEIAASDTAFTNFKSAHQSAEDRRHAYRNAVSEANAARRASVNLFRALANKSKVSNNYTEAIGLDMGIVAVKPVIDLLDCQPVITEVIAMMDHIRLGWLKSVYQGVVIFGAKREQVRELNITDESEDQAGLAILQNLVWEEIGRDSFSPFEDRRTNLSDAPEIRFYKMRYIYNDEPVGLESEIVSVLADIH